MPVYIKVYGSQILTRQAAALGGIDFKRDMVKTIRETARPVVPELRSAARNLQIHGQGTTRSRQPVRRPKMKQLRATMAREIHGHNTKDGWEVLSGDSWAPLATVKGRWKHPVYGHAPLVAQTSRPRNWFYKITTRKNREVWMALGRLSRDLLKRVPSN